MAKKTTNPETENNENVTEKENKIMTPTRVGMTAKDLINAKTSSVQLKSAPERFTCTGLCISKDIDKETGETRDVGYIVADNGTVYGTISATALASIEAILEGINNDEISLPVEVGVALRKSNAGREFITLSIF